MPLPKIQVPARATSLVTRPRLLDDIAPARAGRAGEAAEAGRITLLCGPAGSGKTTLLVDWARHRRREGSAAVAWVSLGPDDNDVFMLWSAILRALELSGAFAAGSPLHRLRTPRRRLDAGFTSEFGLAFHRAAIRPVHLVLDDLQEITEPEALASLDVLLRNVPADLHLLLATRFVPPLALPKLRLEGKIREIDRSRLGFTEPEADALLRLHGVELTSPELRALVSRTEGWAAGLRLAAMSLARSSERSQLLADFAGDNRSVADYLLGEVLERQDPETLRFLLDTSVCEQVTEDLARVLSGREDAGALLDELERTNSFITRLGHGWYRYHPLLRQYLRAELARRRHTRVLEVHRAAAGWFEARGDTLQAIEHAAEAEDDAFLTALLVAHGLRHVTAGEGPRVRRVLRRAMATARRNPAVAAVAAVAAVDNGDPAAARDMLAVWPSSDADADAGRHVVQAVRDLVALYHARAASDPGTAAGLLRKPVPPLTEPDIDMLVHLQRGECLLWLGDAAASTHALGRALSLAQTENRPWLAVQASAALAAAALHAGDLTTAEDYAHDTLAAGERGGWVQSVPCTRARVTLGWIAYHRMDGQVPQVLAGFVAGALGRPTPGLDQLGARLLTAFARYDGTTDRRGIVQDVREAWRLRRSAHVQPQLAAVAAVVEQSIALAVGEAQWAVEVADRTQELLGDTAEVALLRSVMHAYRGRVRAARQTLAPVLRGELPVVSPQTELEAWLWEARLAQRMDDASRADAAAAQAIVRAAPGGLLRPFHRGGDEVHRLLSRSTGTHGHDEAFAARARSLVRPDDTGEHSLLTTRELELLAELPSLRTAEEIAASMYLSVNTVKTHIRGIYRKLGVNNRRDAVLSARRRGLL